MANKITCTCGHSWNKSSSSKKDMRICHICGKDNTMKNGGWLDAYDDEMQLGGYVYPVNYVPQAENGIEGTMGGLTDKGFNYNGAWGGQFQDGGKSLDLAKMRSKMALAAAFGNPSAKRMTSVSPSSYRFSGNEMIDGKSAGVPPGETGTHYMSSMGEYAVPYIQEGPNGKLQFNSNASFRDREAIRFDNPKDARYFAEHYKEVAPMMKRYAMGGSMPGSVGFTYARTKGIPSNGPYAKKTKASAQNGMEMKFYQEGLDWTPKNISKQGSKIKKDDNGYWNPDNWGKPVEIDSNEITMQGVYEPLLGISDTGDTQMMYPGEDYTFDGESVTEYPIAQNGKKVKIPMSDFKKMGNNYLDSVNTYDYTQALWEAVNRGNSSEVDQTISQNKNLIKNTTNVKPTSYDNITVGGKNYRIPNYKYPKMDPWENYEPVKGWWENANTKLDDINNYIGKTRIGKSFQDVNDKIDKGIKNIWHKFVDDDKEDDVQNQGATSSFVKKQPVLPKQSPSQSAKPKPENNSYIKKYPPIYLSNPKDPRIGMYTEKGNQYLYKKPKPTQKTTKPQPKIETKKPEPKKEEPIKKVEQPKPIERKQNIYEGSPVYSPGAGSGLPSALIGFLGQQGDTTYIKPEDYERFAVPKYGKEFIESKSKKKNGGWLDRYN